MILYKEHLVKYFCHLALAHVQYSLYDNVFALLCPISSLSPSSRLQRTRVGGSAGQVVGAGGDWEHPPACPGSPFCLLHLQPRLPPEPAPASDVDAELPEKIREAESRRVCVRVGQGAEGGGGARPAPSTGSLALVVLVRQNFVVFFPFYGRF